MLLFLSLVAFLFNAIHPQPTGVAPPLMSCNETLQTIPDVTICHPGGSVQLNATFSGNPNLILNTEWTPAQGLSNPGILNPVANVTATTTYTITIKHATNNNLFINGNFEAGNTGFQSDYNHSPNNLVPEGVYAITANPSIQHPGFAPCGDHTSGSGNMMAVNGAGTPGQNVWCQTVPVIPNTTYVFSAWVTTLVAASPAILQFSANGVTIGAEFQAPNTTCEWQQFYNLWDSGANTSATFCIVNQNTVLGGNDFALDDIFLGEVCEYEDEITITVLDEIRVPQQHTICFGESIEVGGQSFSNPGNFEVVLTSFLGCDSIIELSLDVIDVQAFISEPLPLSCIVTQSSLDGSLSSSPYGILSYAWSTSNGLLLSDPLAPAVSAGAPGTYQLLVSSSANGVTCFDSVAISLGIDTISPVFSILEPEPLSCEDSIATLTGLAPLAPPGASFEWITLDGFILEGANTLNPLVLGPGTYSLIVTNPENGCSAQQDVLLTFDTLRPIILPLPVPLLTCRDTQVVISIQVPSPASGFTIQWSTPNGLILQGAESLNPLVSAAGQYLVQVTDTIRGCTSALLLNVTEDKLPPVLLLPPTDTLGCQQDSIRPDLLFAPDSIPLQFLWTTDDGLILSGAQTPSPWLGSPGVYTVLAENPANGCRDTAAITVIRFEDAPLADAGPDLVLDCRNDSIQPQSLGSDQGPGISYTWTTPGGLPLDSLLQPWFSQAGTYVLLVLNTLNNCESRDTLTVTDIRALPDILISAPGPLTCTDTEQALDASGSDQGHHTYLWAGPGLLSGQGTPLPSAGLPGWYILTLTDTLNHCTRTDSIFLNQDVAPPLPLLAQPDSLDCNRPQITLNATASQPAGSLTFQWSTVIGNIVNGGNGPSPVVNAGGWYILTLTSPQNGCTASDSVFVFQDPNLPVAAVAEADTLTCLLQSLSLSASYQAPGSNLSFLWTTTNGQILSGATSPNPVIGSPGTYVFTLTDNDTGCQTSDEVTVTQDLFVPPAIPSTPAPLTCADTVRTLSLQGPGTLTVLWSTTGGSILGSPAGPQVQATAPGTYRVRWTNPTNGCSDSTAVLLSQNIIPPLANAGPDRLLPCQPQEVWLDGGISQGQGSLSFQWSTPNGQISDGATQALARVTATGIYLLRVTDPVNGCSASDTVLVRQELPRGLDLELNPPGCRRAEGELALFGSAGGQPPYTYVIHGDPYPTGAALLLAPGIYLVSVLDALGCAFDTVLIMPDRQELILTAPEEVWVVYGDSGRIELSLPFPASGVDTVIWDPYLWLSPTSDPLVWYTHAPLALQYRVRVRTTDGCEAGALIQVLIDRDPRIFVPNVFSPGDGNGINDRFFPYSKTGSVRQIHRMRVFDRWGNQVFLAEDFPPDEAAYGWDGHFQGRLMNPAVFVWVIEAELDNGEHVLLKGDVTLH